MRLNDIISRGAALVYLVMWGAASMIGVAALGLSLLFEDRPVEP